MRVLFAKMYKSPDCKRNHFSQPLKNSGGDSGIFEAILVGFALDFSEIQMDFAAK